MKSIKIKAQTQDELSRDVEIRRDVETKQEKEERKKNP